jgi:hypothetical protein
MGIVENPSLIRPCKLSVPMSDIDQPGNALHYTIALFASQCF